MEACCYICCSTNTVKYRAGCINAFKWQASGNIFPSIGRRQGYRISVREQNNSINQTALQWIEEDLVLTGLPLASCTVNLSFLYSEIVSLQGATGQKLPRRVVVKFDIRFCGANEIMSWILSPLVSRIVFLVQGLI